jgi:hypothetical protein
MIYQSTERNIAEDAHCEVRKLELIFSPEKGSTKNSTDCRSVYKYEYCRLLEDSCFHLLSQLCGKILVGRPDIIRISPLIFTKRHKYFEPGAFH